MKTSQLLLCIAIASNFCSSKSMGSEILTYRMQMANNYFAALTEQLLEGKILTQNQAIDIEHQLTIIAIEEALGNKSFKKCFIRFNCGTLFTALIASRFFEKPVPLQIVLMGLLITLISKKIGNDIVLKLHKEALIAAIERYEDSDDALWLSLEKK